MNMIIIVVAVVAVVAVDDVVDAVVGDGATNCTTTGTTFIIVENHCIDDMFPLFRL